MSEAMTSNRPYFIRAVNEWIIDNGMTPQLLVNTELDDVLVPEKYIEDGRIVLNISPSAVKGLVMGNDVIEFSARFGGTPFQLYIPVISVLAVYARENGLGMIFPEEGNAPAETSGKSKPVKAPHLKVVK